MHVVDTGSTDQLTVQVIGPGMVGTGEFLRTLPRPSTNGMPAMAADVGQRPDSVPFSAHQHQRLTHQVQRHVIADLGDFFLAAEAYPFLAKQLFAFDFEQRFGGIECARHGKGARCVGVPAPCRASRRSGPAPRLALCRSCLLPQLPADSMPPLRRRSSMTRDPSSRDPSPAPRTAAARCIRGGAAGRLPPWAPARRSRPAA